MALSTAKVVAGRPLSARSCGSRRRCRAPRPDPTGARSARREHDLRVAELRGRARPAEHADRLLAAAHLRAAAGGVEVEVAQLLVDLDRGDAERLHARRIQLHADLAVDAAAARHLRDAGDASRRLVMVLSTNQDSSSSVSVLELTA